MAMNKTPTLILGLGGIGCRIAANISALLRPEDRDHIALVGMDTNKEDLAKMEDKGIRTIQTSDDRKVGDFLSERSEYTAWFPVNPFLASRGMLTGAGQIRAISRLAALAAEENGMFVPIKEEFKRIRANRGDNSNGNLTVMVVGSITGGTGAGLFLQMPYYIRKIMRDEDGLDNIVIRGMFVGPDLTVDVQPSDINKAAVRVNAYACLKELNAMYLRQTRPDLEGLLEVDFYTPTNVGSDERTRHMAEQMRQNAQLRGKSAEAIRKDAAVLAKGNPNIPYDYLYLIEGSNAKGGIGNAPLESVESLVGRMVYTLMFTPVSGSALSVEDNMILHDMEYGGMNRYSSAGLCRIVYPMEQVREYVTLCTIRDLVKEEWLLVDQIFNDQVREARSRQRTDGQVEIPLLKDAFRDIFSKQVKGEGRLAKLYGDAYIRDRNNNETTRAAFFMKELTAQIQGVLDSPAVKAAQQECTLSLAEMRSFGTAADEVARVYTEMEEYSKLVKQQVRTGGISIANTLFPPSWESMRQVMDDSKGVYGLLSNTHPLAARFLCYEVLRELERKITVLEPQVSSAVLDGFTREDFDHKTADVQNATEAMENLQEDGIPVVGALVNMIRGENRRLEYLRAKLKSVVDIHRQKNTEYLKNALELTACRVLKKRFEQLSENYRVFFQNMSAAIKENTARISMLEGVELSLGQIGVCCSADAFRTIAAEYRERVDDRLSDKTKKSVFVELFKVLAQDFAQENEQQTERQKTQHIARKLKALNSIFQSAVVDSVRTEVLEKGIGIVDMNVRQALEYQASLEGSEDAVEVYLQKQIAKAMVMAAPMLATSTGAMADNTEMVYLAMHPDCAALQMGQPDVGATKLLYAPQADASTDNLHATVLLDEAFSPYEFTCFKARYKFNIEDLTKYSPDSENAKAYRTRIQNLGNVVTDPLDPDAFKTVVSPHLHRYWHEEAYLPSIYARQCRQDEADTQRAFIYAMGMDSFKRFVGEDADTDGRLVWHWDNMRTLEPVRVCGGVIGNRYTDLLQALPHNGRIKQAILRSARELLEQDKGYRDARELYETILDHWFVVDLIQAGTDTHSDENLLDILLQMRGTLSRETWDSLFTALLEVLWDFCACLFDRNEQMVNGAVKTILEKMLENSTVGKKPEAELTTGEYATKNHVKNLLSARYHRL